MELAQQHLQVLRDETRQVQERLRSAGYNPGAADGVPGPQTVAALRQYQTAQGYPSLDSWMRPRVSPGISLRCGRAPEWGATTLHVPADASLP